MAPTVDFVIPFWGDDPYRTASFKYLNEFLMENFSDLEENGIVHTGPPAYLRSYSRSEARNALASQGEGEVIVFIDADSIPDAGALGDSIGHVLRTKTWMFPFTTYYNLTQFGSKDFMEDPPWKTWRPEDKYEYEYVFPGPDPYDRPPAVGGAVVVHREAWERVKGYDERFRGWGGEDRAFAMALETLVGDTARYPAPIYHLWHPAPESARFGSPDWKYNRDLLERYKDAHNWLPKMTALVNGF